MSSTPAPGAALSDTEPSSSAVSREQPERADTAPDAAPFEQWLAGSPARGLVVDLLMIPHGFGGEIEQAFMDLAQYGPQAVSAIRTLLNPEDDRQLAALSNRYGVDVRGARLRLIEALDHIGGAEAMDAMVELLHSSVYPSELALVAKSLNTHAPGVYREDILIASEATLSVALANFQQARQAINDMTSLLPIYATQGDAHSAAELEAALARLPAFAPVALAGLPEGAGIDSLIRFVNDTAVPDRRKNFPVQILAQASRGYPEAAAALVALAEAGQLTDPAWAALTMALGGTETVVRTSIPMPSAASRTNEPASGFEGNITGSVNAPPLPVQLLYQPNVRTTQSSVAPTSLAYLDYNSKAPQSWPDADIDRQLALIDRLLATKPAPRVAAGLQKAQQSLWNWRQLPLVNGERKAL